VSVNHEVPSRLCLLEDFNNLASGNFAISLEDVYNAVKSNESLNQRGEQGFEAVEYREMAQSRTIESAVLGLEPIKVDPSIIREHLHAVVLEAQTNHFLYLLGLGVLARACMVKDKSLECRSVVQLREGICEVASQFIGSQAH